LGPQEPLIARPGDFLAKTLLFLSAFFCRDSIEYREKKCGFKTCVILTLVSDTGAEPNEDRKH